MTGIRIGKDPAEVLKRLTEIEEEMALRAAGMLAIDTFSTSPEFTGSVTSWTHIPKLQVNTLLQYPTLIRGVLVAIIQKGTAEDQIESVKYGAATMTELAGSPQTFTKGTAKGCIHFFWLGQTIGQTSETVQITPKASSTDVKMAGCWTVLGNNEVVPQINSATLDAELVANSNIPTTQPAIRTGSRALTFAAALTEVEASKVTPQEVTQDFTKNFGGNINAYWGHKVPPMTGSSVEGFTHWFTTAAAKAAAIVVTVHERRDIGIQTGTSLSSTAGLGDRCSFDTGAFAFPEGEIWDLVFDGKGEFPWKYQGGVPHIKTVGAGVEANTGAAYTKLSGGPELAVPLAGEYLVQHGCSSSLSGGTSSNMWAAIFAAAAEVATSVAIDVEISQFGGASICSLPVVVKMAQGGILDQRVKGFSNNVAWTWSNRWIKVWPIRVK
jgi:hypothetical protein